MSDSFEKDFKSPQRTYGIYPIVHSGAARIGAEENSPLAERLDRQGFAGMVGNVPYGENFPDDPQEWSDTEKGFRKIISKGMKTWIYDEKGYPSGSAGGVVIENNPDHPEFLAVGLYCYEYWRTLTGPGKYRADVPGDHLEYAMLLPLDGGEAIDITHCANSNGTLHFDIPLGTYHLFMMSSRRLFDGTHAAESYSEPRDYINLCDKGATEAFIKVTHENYAKVLSDEFGKGVRAFFTDEPSLISWNIRTGVYPIIPWHRDFPDKFLKRFGYPISLATVAVVTRRGPELIKRRCDFWDFVADEVAENYFGVIQKWCHENGMFSSGHMLEEERLSAHVYNYGSLYRCAKKMDWPGIDQLDSEPQRLMSTDRIPIARLLSSFADVYGSGESFTEFSDHTSRMENKQIGMNWIKGSVNWHYAMGINNMTSYYNFENFRDDEIKDLNLYTARIGYMIRKGKRYSRTAVLYPEAAIWSSYTPSTLERGVDLSEDTQRVEKTFAKISWELIHRQIDFDYIDEALIQQGTIEDGTLKTSGRKYSCVIFPACHVLSEKTVRIIRKMSDAGIGIVFIGGLPEFSRETGDKAGFYEILSPCLGRPKFTEIPIATGWSLPGMNKIPAIERPYYVTPDDLSCVLLGAQGTADIKDGEVICADILSHSRKLDDGRMMVFLCNMGGKKYRGHLHIKTGAGAEMYDPEDGDVRVCKSDNEYLSGDDMLALPVVLRPYQSMIYLTKA